jgi:hypothetical protein
MATNNTLNNSLINCSGLPIPGGVTATGTPSATTFLRGDGSWSAPSYEFISSQTASASSSIVFTGLSSTYSTYYVFLDNVVAATDAANLLLRTSSDNGVSYDTGASDYIKNSFAVNSDAGSGATGQTASFILVAAAVENTPSLGISSQITIINPSNSSYRKSIFFNSYYQLASGLFQFQNAASQRTSTDAINAIQFIFSPGNITTGTFKLYGIRAL